MVKLKSEYFNKIKKGKAWEKTVYGGARLEKRRKIKDLMLTRWLLESGMFDHLENAFNPISNVINLKPRCHDMKIQYLSTFTGE